MYEPKKAGYFFKKIFFGFFNAFYLDNCTQKDLKIIYILKSSLFDNMNLKSYNHIFIIVIFI